MGMFLRHFKIFPRIMLFMLLMLSLFTFFIIRFSTAVTHLITSYYVSDYVKSSQRQVTMSFESVIDEFTMASLRFKTSSALYLILGNKHLSLSKKLANFRQISKTLLSASEKAKIGDIYIVGRDGACFELNPSKKHIFPPDKTFLRQIRVSTFSSADHIIKDRQGNGYILYGTKFNNFYTGESFGCLIFYIREDTFCRIYNKIISQKGYSFILSNKNRIISDTDKKQLGRRVVLPPSFRTSHGSTAFSQRFRGKQSVVSLKRLSRRMRSIGFDWEVVSVLPYDKLFGVIPRIQRLIIAFELGTWVSAMLVAVLISKRMTTSLRGLRDKICSIGRGKLDTYIQGNSHDEIWELEQGFNDMVARIQDLIRKNDEEKERQREMELLALQAQINPHFLYNTLDTIGWIAQLKNQKEIGLLVEQLASFFRISLHKGDKYVTVDEEVNLVKSYVTIQQMSNPGRFDISYCITEEIRSVKMLKIVLQPIVENAIRHGVEQKKGKGHIEVTGKRIGDVILFEVIDNGKGFDPAAVNLKNPKNEIGKTGGYGLSNVDERIKLEYGPDCGIQVESRIGKGTRITVRLRIKL